MTEETPEEQPSKGRRRRDEGETQLFWTAIMMLVAFAALVSFQIIYTNRKAVEADRRWCDMIIGLDDNYRAAPPGSLPPRTVVFAKQIHKLRQDLRCKDTVVVPQTPRPSASR